MPKGNQKPSSKGGGEGERLRCAKICSQSTELIKHVHQKLTMSRLNGHYNLQRTTNVKVIRSRWWRNSSSNSSNRINKRLTKSSTCRRGRRGCDTKRLNSRTFRALSHISSHLPKKGGTYGSNYVYGFKSGEVI